MLEGCYNPVLDILQTEHLNELVVLLRPSTVQSEAVRLTSWPEGGNCPSAEASSLCNTGRLPQNGATEKRHVARDMIGSLDGAKQYRTLAFRVDSFCLGRRRIRHC